MTGTPARVGVRALKALSLCLWLLWACDVVDDEGPPAPQSMTGASTASDDDTDKDSASATGPVECKSGRCFWSSPEDNACVSVGSPTRDDAPQASIEGDTELEAIHLGLSRLWLGETNPDGVSGQEAWHTLGLDLDGLCSNPAACEEPTSVQASCMHLSDQLPFDGSSCRDATFARFMPVVAQVPELGQVLGLREEAINCSLYHGAYNIILRISAYNGEPNDDHVELDVYASGGQELNRVWHCPLEGFAEMYPLWRPSSTFTVAERYLDGPQEDPESLPPSKYRTDQGYVRDGYLVASLDMPIEFNGEHAAFVGWSMFLRQAILTGRLELGHDGSWALVDGALGGRLANEDLITSFRRLAICPEGPFASLYQSIEQYVQDGSDLLANGSNNASLPCDAMSVGLSFEAMPLSLGEVVPFDEQVDCCLPENSDSANCGELGCGDGQVVGEETCDTGIAAGEPGACPTVCESEDPCLPSEPTGSGCRVICPETRITERVDGDGCCPDGARVGDDSDCTAVCGDSIIEGTETCDPPGSCLTAETCVSVGLCSRPRFVGDANECTANCQQVPITTCADDDDCCATGCTYRNDNDCPRPEDCGNGMLDPGESCDPPSTCNAQCDDGDPCTLEAPSGSAETCTLRCESVPVTSCMSGDGCCLTGCTAADSDCEPECGNSVREEGEACDDGNDDATDGCADCQLQTPAEQCDALINTGVSEECAACQCANCADAVINCLTGDNAERNERCRAVVGCAAAKMCSGDDCLCGDRDIVACLITPAGPCIDEIFAAAGTQVVATVNTRRSDPRFPLADALAISDCTDANCRSECLE